MKFILLSGIIFIAGIAALLFMQHNNVYTSGSNLKATLPLVASTTPREEPVLPLTNPPEVIRAAYYTKYFASSDKRINNLIALSQKNLINSVVIDFKDYTGVLSYDSKIDLAKKYHLSEPIIKDVKALIRKLHQNNIYVIARISVFQDSALVKARPDLAVKSFAHEAPWKDHKGIMWLDANNQEVWDYIVDISKELRGDGIDEINFDYIRFPSDGILSDMRFNWRSEVHSKALVIKEFVNYLKEKLLPNIPISFDIFGQTLINHDDVNIGQLFENFVFDGSIIAPMVYPSHYVSGFIGYNNPADHPYEVMKYSLDLALSRIHELEIKSSTTIAVKVRPWVQFFDLGANYTPAMINKELASIHDSLATSTVYQGYNFWDPRNLYPGIEQLKL